MSVRFLVLATALLIAGCSGMRDTSRTFDTVVVDAGHGKHDTGAIGRARTYEKDVALDTALRLQRHLEQAGFRVVMTRRTDHFLSLPQRTQIANREPNAVFVSVHYNHARRASATGVETFYHHGHSARLARSVQSNVLRIGTVNRGVKTANFHVIRETRIPAILVEGGFLSNRGEEARIRTPEYREHMARLIARGLMETRYGGAAASRHGG